MSNALTCPRCEVREFTPYGSTYEEGDPPPPALSRVSDIYICNWCGTHEAFMDMGNVPLPPPSAWPVVIPEALLELVP